MTQIWKIQIGHKFGKSEIQSQFPGQILGIAEQFWNLLPLLPLVMLEAVADLIPRQVGLVVQLLGPPNQKQWMNEWTYQTN